MTLKLTLLTTAFMFVGLPALPALAHDDDGNDGHDALHDQLDDAHERAHEEGFESRAEHREYHRALRNFHESYHDDRDGYTSYYRPRYYYSYPRYRSSGWSYGW